MTWHCLGIGILLINEFIRNYDTTTILNRVILEI